MLIGACYLTAGMHMSKALPITYTLFYVGMWTIAPNITDTIADIFPPLNGVMLILFLYSAYKTITAFFKGSNSPKESAQDLKQSKPTINEQEINREISEDKHEIKDLKKKTMRLNLIGLRIGLDALQMYLRS